MSRSLAREDAFKLIFEMEVTDISADDALEYLFTTVAKTNEMWAQKFINASNRKYIDCVVRGIGENKALLNEKIEPCLKDWTINRISKVNLAVLHLALFEIFFVEDIPNKVSVSEAVLLAKKYAGSESASFVNGVLGTVMNSLEETEEN